MNPMDLVYLFGPPAAGKSTLMAALTRNCVRFPMAKPFAHDLLIRPTSGTDVVGIELGKSRAAFPGTDGLGMSVAPRARAFLAGTPADLILGEGDRLAHNGFLDAAADSGYSVTGVYLTAPADVLEARCAARGSTQSASWRAGRATKAANLANYAQQSHVLVSLDGTADPADNIALLMGAVPGLRVLPQEVSL